MERMLYLGYLSGATFVHHESDAFADSIWVENYGRRGNYRISPFGLATRRWFDFTQRHPDRGVPYTPFAIMIDANHGWCPAEDLIWRAFPKTPGERAMDEVANLFFPWGFTTAGERGYLTHGPFGDTVDFISHEADVETLTAYPVLMLLGDVPVDEDVASRLRGYVESGGTLVMDAGQRSDLLGEQITNAWAGEELAYSAGARCADDSAPIPTVPYAYRPLRGGIGTAWWRTGDGRSLVVEIPHGSGRIVLIAVPHLLDIRGRLLPFVKHVVARLYDGLLPAQVSGDIEFTLARNSRGWVIGLINSKGGIKRPTEPARASTQPDAEVEIAAPWRASAVEEWTADRPLQNLAEEGTRVSLTVPAGQVRVVFLRR